MHACSENTSLPAPAASHRHSPLPLLSEITAFSDRYKEFAALNTEVRLCYHPPRCSVSPTVAQTSFAYPLLASTLPYHRSITRTTPDAPSPPQVLGVSIDSQFTHLAWIQTDRKSGGLGDLAYPLVADLKKEISCAPRNAHDPPRCFYRHCAMLLVLKDDDVAVTLTQLARPPSSPLAAPTTRS